MNAQKEHKPKIRVLVVDDSLVSQRVCRQIISSDDRFELVGIAGDGAQAVKEVVRLTPDVVSMDVMMPGMDGIEATRRIMAEHPVPVVVSSNMHTPPEKDISIHVLDAGAVNVVEKPVGPKHPDYEKLAKKYLNMLKAMAEIRVVRRRSGAATQNNELVDSTPQPLQHVADFANRSFKVLVIGASAGGPQAIRAILNGLGPGFPLPILIVQHIDPRFAPSFREWLASNSPVPVIMPETSQQIFPGYAYCAPGGKHLLVNSENVVSVSDAPPVNGHRPSVAALLESVAKVYKEQAIAVILSGMGTDGAYEMKHLTNIGALTFAQSQDSCIVFGMPGETVKLHGAVAVLPPDEIVKEIKDLVIKKSKNSQ